MSFGAPRVLRLLVVLAIVAALQIWLQLGARPAPADVRATSVPPVVAVLPPLPPILPMAPSTTPSSGSSASLPRTTQPPAGSAPAHRGSPGTSGTPEPLASLGAAQPAAIVYGGNERLAQAYAHPGGLVVAGRGNYQNQVFKDVSAAGGTVLVYLDPIIDEAAGRYDGMLLNASECGPNTPRWPGVAKASGDGYLNDFRVGGSEQGKLECVLEKMVAENPHIGGWFADDLGSRPYFPGFDWDSWSLTDKSAYRDGAIALSQTFRRVADRHGLIFLVNGSWAGGAVEKLGGGYPVTSQHGNALADGGVLEHHDGDEDYFGPYTCSTQWAAQTRLSRGRAVMYSISRSDAGRDAFVRGGCLAYAGTQSDYGTPPAPWTGFHPAGMPHRVRR